MHPSRQSPSGAVMQGFQRLLGLHKVKMNEFGVGMRLLRVRISTLSMLVSIEKVAFDE
jgi:hypothetical protein